MVAGDYCIATSVLPILIFLRGGKGWRWEVRVKRLRVRVVVCCTLTHSLKLLDIELGRIDQTGSEGIFDDFVGGVDAKFPEDVLAVRGYGMYA